MFLRLVIEPSMLMKCRGEEAIFMLYQGESVELEYLFSDSWRVRRCLESMGGHTSPYIYLQAVPGKH